MSKNFEAKKVVVSEIEEKIEKAESIVIVEYKALTVEAITALRAKCRAANVDYCVLKNTLMKRALENKGIKIDDAILEGPNAFVFSNGDPVSAPKLVKEFITAAEKDKKTSPLTIKAGIMDGAVQSVEEVKALADILPREQHGLPEFSGDCPGLRHPGDCRQEGRSRRAVSCKRQPDRRHLQSKQIYNNGGNLPWKSMRSFPLSKA
mgnify:CR=1 FL=1